MRYNSSFCVTNGLSYAYPTGKVLPIQTVRVKEKKEMATQLVFLPGESYGQRSLAGSNPQGRRVRHD